MHSFDHVPDAMRSRRQWVLWRYEHRDGRPTKVPYQITGQRASSVDPTHWATFEQATASHAASSEVYDGIGYMFSGDPGDFVGIDLDGCLDGEELIDWAREILDRVPGYAEISPSGRGIKIFAAGAFPSERGRKVRFSESAGIELYARGRYFTVTGRRIPSVVGDASQGLQWIAETYFRPTGADSHKSAQESTTNVLEPQKRPAGQPAPEYVDPLAALDRARAYAAAYPPAISGQDGHGTTFRLACVLVNGFALDRGAALGVLQGWNSICEPPWSARELEHKIDSAVEVGQKEGNRGYMLATDRSYHAEPVDDSEYEVYLGDLEASYMRQLDATFPAELYHVPGFIADVAGWITSQNHRPNLILSLLGGIALQAALVSRKVRDRTGVRTNLYLVALAPSSGGKQAPQSCIQEILGLTGQTGLYGGKVASDSAVAQDLMASPAKLYIFDEFGRFLSKTREDRGGAHLHAVQEVLLELWGATRNPLWKHKSMANAKFNREVSYPCLSFLGFTVPESFWDGLEESHLIDGFAARLIVIDSGPRVDARTATEAAPPESIIERAAYWRDFAPGGNLAVAGRYDPLIIPATPEAEKLFDDLVKFQESKEGAVAEAIWSRAIEKSRRLALVYACSRDHEHSVVDAEAATWAIRFVKWSTETFLARATEEVTGGEVFQQRWKKVLGIIRDKSKRRNVCTRSDLLRATKWRAKDLEDVLQSLEASEQIVASSVGTGKTAKLTYRIAR